MKTKKIALMGMLGALALALSALESTLLPALPFLPAGAKPGLSNIVTMLTASVFGFPGALGITVIKALFALASRGITAFAMSLTGGVLSTVAMCLLFRAKKKPFSFTGIGVICAVLHNAGQLFVACIMTGTAAMLGYAPFLLVFSVITGLATGTLFRVVLPPLTKVINTKGSAE